VAKLSMRRTNRSGGPPIVRPMGGRTWTKVNKCFDEFQAIASKYKSEQSALAALMHAAFVYTFTKETVTEAVDAFRVGVPAIESGIRSVFPKMMDMRQAMQKARMPSEPHVTINSKMSESQNDESNDLTGGRDSD
jgi:hypothetical protein